VISIDSRELQPAGLLLAGDSELCVSGAGCVQLVSLMIEDFGVL
jgi:hypothetical protein